MGLNLTLYLDALIDNSESTLEMLNTLLPNQPLTIEKQIYQSDVLPFLVEFLPLCIVQTDDEEWMRLLSDSNDFESIEAGKYRLKERMVRDNAIYYSRPVIPEQLILFTLRNCPACEEAKALLSQLEIPFQEHSPASKIRRQLRVAKAPSFFYENRYLFSDIKQFKHTIWADRF